MKRHLVIFMKAPSLGRVKRRLAIDIGATAALTFCKRCLDGLFVSVSRDLATTRGFSLWLAITPDRSARRGAWRLSGPFSFSRGTAFIPQGSGDLGTRMARVFGRLPGGAAVLIGGDIPALTSVQIAQAFDRLRSYDVVFGPATDGGYYLVGIRDKALARNLFDNVRWSTAQALADTLANLDGRKKVALLDPLEDVDDGKDFQRWQLGKAQRGAFFKVPGRP